MSHITQVSRRPVPRLPARVLPPAPVAYLDIETTGLSAADSHVTLVGLVARTRGGRCLEQFFVDSPKDEADVLEQVIDRLRGLGGVVTFNGHSFDLPFLRARAREHGLRLPWIDGWDLLREAWQWQRESGAAGSCRLRALMSRFGIKRTDRTTGDDMVAAYWRWLENGDRSARRLILAHNADDVMLLPELAACLVERRGRERARAL